MTCHNCRHNREIEQLREICSKCRVADGHMSDSVSLNAVLEGTEDDFLNVAPGFSMVTHDDPADKMDGERTADSDLPFSEETREALLRLVHEFTQLPPVVAQVFHALLNRRTVKDVAVELGWSKQRLHARVKNAVARFPAFAAVYMATRARPECAPINPKPRQRRARS